MSTDKSNSDDALIVDELAQEIIARKPTLTAVLADIAELPALLNPLFNFAVDVRQFSLAASLLEEGADINWRMDSSPVLYWAVQEGEAALDKITWLLQHGAEVNCTACLGAWSPLHLAALRGSRKIVELLLDNGADIDLRSKIDDRETPLMQAAWGGHLDLVEWMLQRGADPSRYWGAKQEPTTKTRDEQIQDFMHAYRRQLGLTDRTDRATWQPLSENHHNS